MKRCAAKLLLYLLAGAIVNVIVAWGWSVLRSSLQSFKTAIPSEELSWGLAGPPEQFPEKPAMGFLAKDWAMDTTSLMGMDGTSWRSDQLADGSFVTFSGGSPTHVFSKSEYRAGWPFRSMVGATWSASFWQPLSARVPMGIRTQDAWVWLSPPANASLPVVVPYSPIWPGFAMNTLFYAAFFWLLFTGPSALRRIMHRWRNQCLACGYPVGASPLCTECGAAIAPIPGGSINR